MAAPQPARAGFTIERILSASPERVFRAWTDPEELILWLSPSPEGSAEVDLRVGGRFRIVMSGGGREIEHTGEYRELEIPHRLVFTWASEFTDGESVVTVELHPSAGGKTRLVLSHELLPASHVKSHEQGWGTFLDALNTRLKRAFLIRDTPEE